MRLLIYSLFFLLLTLCHALPSQKTSRSADKGDVEEPIERKEVTDQQGFSKIGDWLKSQVSEFVKGWSATDDSLSGGFNSDDKKEKPSVDDSDDNRNNNGDDEEEFTDQSVYSTTAAPGSSGGIGGSGDSDSGGRSSVGGGGRSGTNPDEAVRCAEYKDKIVDWIRQQIAEFIRDKMSAGRQRRQVDDARDEMDGNESEAERRQIGETELIGWLKERVGNHVFGDVNGNTGSGGQGNSDNNQQGSSFGGHSGGQGLNDPNCNKFKEKLIDSLKRALSDWASGLGRQRAGGQ